MLTREKGSETPTCTIEHATWSCTKPDGHAGLCSRTALPEATDRQTAVAVDLRELGS